ncbi:hypothetical protein [Mesorhizobium sp. 131-2-1]|uniref:hypothetical protein n=1 Tax=Mesorhizobium sp. 131-2-1 TaxID=2744518 RepID=UPI001938C222|nr:hypothetical protein [Mesorhizobium sp. 131-2-1]BCG97762.1 hypothetical protein MesoLj131a_66260 [Mesorhizobium sp. 131-2-1]
MGDLAGLKVALSVSDAPDRARLGFPSREIDRVLLTICTVLVRAGCDILYAGNLDPNQSTFKIFRHLAGAYAGGREKAPFVHIIPEPIARRTSFVALHAALRENGGITRTSISLAAGLVPVRASGDVLLLGNKGLDRKRVGSHDEWTVWLDGHERAQPTDAYTKARAAVSAEADARVVLGGKMGVLDRPDDLYEGAMPGIAEEAILTLTVGRPLVVLGAFGGASRDVAIALGLLARNKAVPRGKQQASYALAMDQVSALAHRIPAEVRPYLAAIADDDRGEPTAYAIAEAIATWRATAVL